ncbi:hypothetical protein ACFU8W_18260 [Streptomyces sp. NPDC057565]|uniref:hypothetical protein n=1 Tax=Streptomyces sp. NPDC057565 TaxID=3346169 RepID=UPI003689A5A6
MRAPHLKRSLAVVAASVMLAGGAAVGAAGTATAAPAHETSVASNSYDWCGWWNNCYGYGYGYDNGYGYGYDNGYGYGPVAIVLVTTPGIYGGYGGY